MLLYVIKYEGCSVHSTGSGKQYALLFRVVVLL